MAAPSEDRFVGCLIGQCLGAAVGFLVKDLAPAVSRHYVDQLLEAGDAGTTGGAPSSFGQYAHASQLARELLQSYVALGRFDPADYARHIAAIFAEGRIVGGGGRANEQAARRLVAGVSWERSATPSPSAGNGSAMRAAPVGLLFSTDAEALVRAARDQGRITHADPRCAAGAVAIAGGVALMASDEAPEPGAVLARLANWAGAVEPGFARHLHALEGWLALAPEEAREPISRAGLEPGYRDGREGISPFVVPSVLWSLYAVLRSPDDYWATIMTAIEVGGDIDTMAAMAGALSGARVGLAGLPGELARRLDDQGAWGFEELAALARAAHAIAVASPVGA